MMPALLAAQAGNRGVEGAGQRIGRAGLAAHHRVAGFAEAGQVDYEELAGCGRIAGRDQTQAGVLGDDQTVRECGDAWLDGVELDRYRNGERAVGDDDHPVLPARGEFIGNLRVDLSRTDEVERSLEAADQNRRPAHLRGWRQFGRNLLPAGHVGAEDPDDGAGTQEGNRQSSSGVPTASSEEK